MSAQNPVLLVDHGNTWLKWLLAEAGDTAQARLKARHRGRIASAGLRDVGPLAVAWRQLSAPRAVWMASVGGEQGRQAVIEGAGKLWQIKARRIEAAAEAAGVRCGYQEPRRLGVDRWAAVVAAWARKRRACLVVDCGSAITIDALDATGQHRGGVIFPGVGLMQTQFYSGTAAKRRLDDSSGGTIQCFGKDTHAAIVSGAFLAVAGGIDRVITEMQAQLGESLHGFVTGGDSTQLLPLLRARLEPVQDLVFEGIAILGELTE